MGNNRNMEEKTASSVNINIYGGTNQILPNATKAEQHFHYEQGKPEVSAPDEPSRPWSSDDERRLSLYIEKEETLEPTSPPLPPAPMRNRWAKRSPKCAPTNPN